MSKEDETGLTMFEQAVQALRNGYPVYRDLDWEGGMERLLNERASDEGRKERRRDGAANLDSDDRK